MRYLVILVGVDGHECARQEDAPEAERQALQQAWISCTPYVHAHKRYRVRDLVLDRAPGAGGAWPLRATVEDQGWVDDD
jgi:hypothetical protein